MIRDAEDPVVAWAEIYTWYMEISGQGLNQLLDKCLKFGINNPAKDDSEILRLLQEFEKMYRDGVARGMDTLGEPTRISIIKDICPKHMRNRLDRKNIIHTLRPEKK